MYGSDTAHFREPADKEAAERELEELNSAEVFKGPGLVKMLVAGL